jgi:hypothetical protein
MALVPNFSKENNPYVIAVGEGDYTGSRGKTILFNVKTF